MGGGDLGGRGRFFAVPVRPDISMNLGKNCFRKAFNNFKFHLHGLKRYGKKPPPAPQVPTRHPRRPKITNHLLGRNASNINLISRNTFSTKFQDIYYQKTKKSAINHS